MFCNFYLYYRLQKEKTKTSLPGQRIVLQALVIAVLFTHVTCVPPPHVFVHWVQQVLPEIQEKVIISGSREFVLTLLDVSAILGSLRL